MRDYHMANSKAYASFVLLFAFLLTHNLVQSTNGNDYNLMPPWYNGAAEYHPSNVNDIGTHDNDYGPPPPLYADSVDYQPLDVKHIGIHDNDLRVPPPWYNGVVDNYQPSHVKDIGVHPHVELQERFPPRWLPSKIEPPTDEENFHKSPRLEHERNHHSNAIDYQLLGLKYTAVPPEWLPPRSQPTKDKDEKFHNQFIESHRDHRLNCIEGKNYKDGTEMMSHRRMMRPHKENNDLRSFHASPVKI